MLARTAAILSLSLLTGCESVQRRPFRNATDASARALPAGVRLGLRLDGVHEFTNEGMPMRRYEMYVDIEQPGGRVEWQPSFAKATLHDDEGRAFPMSAWFIDSRKKQPPNLRRYRVVFEIQRPYRFASILTAIVRWKLVAQGQQDVPITSRFRG